MHVKQADDGESLVSGTFYIAPAASHLLVTHKRFALSREGRVKYVQPSGDRLFESAAAAYGDRLIAVVLSAKGSDGSDGARVVHPLGGWSLPKTRPPRSTPRCQCLRSELTACIGPRR